MNNDDEFEAKCPACSSRGQLRFAEKIEDKLFNELTYASRKRPELMHYDLFECPNCYSLFTKRNIDITNLLKKYEIAEYDSNTEAKFAAKTYVSTLRNALPDHFKGSVLDIGAGDGAFLSEARSFFATSNLGIEPSIKAIEKCEDVGVKLSNVAIENFETEEKFDLVTCFQTIEHLNDPRNFVENIKTFLGPGSYLAISCHNRLSTVNRILGEKSPIFDVEHLQVFTDNGIELFLKSLGFKIVYSKKYKNTYPLSYWLKIAPIGEKLKDLVEKNKKLFNVPISINVGNHMIIGKLS